MSRLSITAVILATAFLAGAPISSAMGIVTYWGSSPVYIDLSETNNEHFYAFEVQNADDEDISVSVMLNSPVAFLVEHNYFIRAKTSKKITMTIRLPSNLAYDDGDYIDVIYQVTQAVESGGDMVTLKRGMSSDFTIIIGDKGQDAMRPLGDVPYVSDDDTVQYRGTDGWLYGGLNYTGNPDVTFKSAEDIPIPDPVELDDHGNIVGEVQGDDNPQVVQPENNVPVPDDSGSALPTAMFLVIVGIGLSVMFVMIVRKRSVESVNYGVETETFN